MCWLVKGENCDGSSHEASLGPAARWSNRDRSYRSRHFPRVAVFACGGDVSLRNFNGLCIWRRSERWRSDARAGRVRQSFHHVLSVRSGSIVVVWDVDLWIFSYGFDDRRTGASTGYTAFNLWDIGDFACNKGNYWADLYFGRWKPSGDACSCNNGSEVCSLGVHNNCSDAVSSGKHFGHLQPVKQRHRESRAWAAGISLRQPLPPGADRCTNRACRLPRSFSSPAARFGMAGIGATQKRPRHRVFSGYADAWPSAAGSARKDVREA